MPSQSDFSITISADDQVVEAVQCMDWGVVVVEHQGGVDVLTVGLPHADAASLLRKAADALEKEA